MVWFGLYICPDKPKPIYSGVWQEKTDIVNSAFLARYTINADSIWYSVNEYDGLNPIRSFGGTYTIDRDSISIRIQYIKRVSHTAICRDQFLPANNQWSILDEGSLATDTLPAPQKRAKPTHKTNILERVAIRKVTTKFS